MTSTASPFKPNINHLPSETLLDVLAFLTPHDLCSNVCQVNRLLFILCQKDTLWKNHVERVWMIKDKDPGTRWIDVYRHMQTQYPGGYARVYRPVKTVLERLKQWVSSSGQMKSIVEDLNPGATEDELQRVAQAYGEEEEEGESGLLLPVDYRMLMRLYNGQIVRNLSSPLFGSFRFYNYLGAGFLMSTNSQLQVRESVKQRWTIIGKNLLPVIAGGQFIVFMALRDIPREGEAEQLHGNGSADVVPRGSILQLTDDGVPIVLAECMLAFLEKYTNDLESGRYDVIDGQGICQFPALPSLGSDVTTHGVRIRANALFFPPQSNVSEQIYMWAYRIKISMSDTESPDRKCRLVSRHWRVVDSNGDEETVDGPGVIGLFPVAEPGSYFEYTSCTTLPTSSGKMGGHFVFEQESTGMQFRVIVGDFLLDTSLHL